MGRSVVGIDVGERSAAPISYLRYDGAHFPARNASVDVVLFCYVLHHARDALVFCWKQGECCVTAASL